MTNVIPSKAIGDALESARAASPRPAAGMPPPASSGKPQLRDNTASPESRNSKRGGAGRSGKFAAIDDEEEDGRTVVRGAPKIVKRAPSSHKDLSGKMGGNTMPTTISPAAVIKATLESAKAGKRGDRLMSPPPNDLLEELADLHPADASEHTKILPSTSTSVAAPISQAPHSLHGPTQAMGSHPISQGSLPPSSVRPVSGAPPAMMNQSGGYPAQQSGAWAAQYNGAMPSGAVSVPGVAVPAAPQSMPAHFMVPQAPYSDARIDPPGTALTARTRASGRPAMSWAVALMAFGLFVGVGAFAAMNKGESSVLMTSAAFVDPARGGQAPVAAGALQAPAAPVALPVAASPVDPNAVATAPGVTVPAAPATVAAAVALAPGAPAPTVAVAPVAAPPATVAVPPATVAAAAAPAPAPAAAPAPTTRHARSGGGTRVAAAAPEEAPAPPPAKAARPAKGGKAAADNGGGVDEEQKKALKALQESQLESTF